MKSFNIDPIGDVTVIEPVTPAASAPAPEAERLPCEEWATRKGMFPQLIHAPRGGSVDAMPTPDGRGLFVNMAREANVGPRTNASFWKFAAAKSHNQWPIGLTMTEAEFDKAIVAATDGITIR